MVVPPDSDNSSTASPAGSDLTLNGPTSAADVDAVADLRLKPEVDSSSTLVSEHVPLDQRDSVPPGAPGRPQRPHVAIFFTGEADRSWWSRLLSLKTPWKRELPSLKAPSDDDHLRPSAHDEPVTLEAIGAFEKPPVPAALSGVGASIAQGLATVEDVGGQRAGAAIDAAVRDLCSQTYDRLVRVEAAIQRTEGFVAEKAWDPSTIAHQLERIEETLRLTQKSLADSMLPEVYVSIEKQFGQVRTALQRTEEVVADKTLHELCRNIDSRLERTEDTLHRGEGVVAERLQELAARMTARFGEVDETLRLTQKSLADSVLPEVCDDIQQQLIQARTALQRTEEAVADKSLHELCQNIDARLERTEDTLHRGEGILAESLQQLSARMTARFGEVEEMLRLTQKSVADSMPPEMGVNIERQLIQARTALQRTEDAVADKTLYELCQNIEARLERTEGTLHRSEGFVAEGFQEFSARMTARFAKVEETIQRIERIVSSKVVEQQPSVREDDRRVQAVESVRPVDGGVLASAALFLNRFAKIKQTNRPVQLPWVAGLAVPVLVVVAVLAIGALIRPNRDAAPDKVATLATADQIPTPVVPAAKQEIRPASSTVVMANGPRPTRERLVSTPEPPRSRAAAPTITRPPTFVGTLSITSVPSGASVSINGKPAGVTPLRLPRQRAGSLAVQIAHDGFERWSAAVRVPADRLTNVSAKLRATAR
jgi:ElaB/YqjD/DUF883 family membrane-anchored ribosome-binding protein